MCVCACVSMCVKGHEFCILCKHFGDSQVPTHTVTIPLRWLLNVLRNKVMVVNCPSPWSTCLSCNLSMKNTWIWFPQFCLCTVLLKIGVVSVCNFILFTMRLLCTLQIAFFSCKGVGGVALSSENCTFAQHTLGRLWFS